MYVSLSGVDSKLMGVAPLLIWPERLPASLPLDSIGGPKGPNAQFLRDFGKTLVEKYNPKAIVVFSAHWETHGHIEGNHTPPPWWERVDELVMSYERNHLLYDYYNFPEEMYKVQFESNGSPAVASRIVELLNNVSLPHLEDKNLMIERYKDTNIKTRTRS